VGTCGTQFALLTSDSCQLSEARTERLLADLERSKLHYGASDRWPAMSSFSEAVGAPGQRDLGTLTRRLGATRSTSIFLTFIVDHR
jgi:hypothetical protein